jgi:hypothetical protein
MVSSIGSTADFQAPEIRKTVQLPTKPDQLAISENLIE